MIELTCVSCGATASVEDRAEEKRSRTCAKCGASLIEMRHPGGTPSVSAQAAAH